MDEGLLVSIVVVEVALLATSLVVLVGRAVSLAARQRRQSPRIAHAARSLRPALDGRPLDRDSLKELARLPTNAQVRVFGNLSTSLGGSQKQHLARIAADVGLLEKAERWCSSRRWGTRLRGVRVLTLLGGGGTVVPPLFDDPRPEVRAQAAQWAGDHPKPDSIDRLLSMLSDPETLCRFTVKDSLLRVEHAAADPLLRSLMLGATPEALEVAVGIADARFLGPALESCRSPDARIRSLAAALAGSIGGSQATDALTELLRDPDLNVRAAAARGIGKLGHWPAAGALAELLRDSSWDVRRAAALGLRALGAPGTLLLRRALSESRPLRQRHGAAGARATRRTPTPGRARARRRPMSAMISIPSLLSGLDWAILFYFLAVNGFYLVLLAFATLEMRRHLLRIREESRLHVLGSEVAPTLSMIAPAHNEGSTVAESVRALLTLQYPNLEVVLVNDGSSDDTLAVLEREFELVPIHPIYRRRLEHAEVTDLYRSSVKPNLVVVDKRNGGKADALNAGLNVARGELVCAIDADTLIEPDALLRMARPFLNGSDVVAAGGTVRVVNGSRVKGGRVSVARAPRHPLAGIQAVEYLRAFLFGRLGWNRLGGNLIISGAFGLFRREPVIAAGGYLHDTVGEDMELVARLRRLGAEQGTSQRVEFIPDPVAWTEVPESLRVLGRQRDRWQRGLADVLWRHRHVMLRPRYGALGLVAFPYFVLVELLAPVVELVGLIGLGAALAIGAVDGSFALLFFLVAYGFGVLLTCLTLVLDDLSFPRYGQVRDRLVLVPWAVLESLGYRQLTAYWRLRGLVKFLRGRKDWGVMTRTGFAAQAELPGDSSV